MAYASDNYSPPVRRRTTLRAVPPPSRQLAAEPLVRLSGSPAEEEGLLETLRKLWRRRGLIALSTVVIGGAAFIAAWLTMPAAQGGGLLALMFILFNNVLVYYFATACFSPSAVKYTPPGAAWIRYW